MLPIYVDLDDVIAETTRPCIDILNRMFGREIPYEAVTAFSFQDVFDLSRHEFEAFMAAVHQPDILLSFQPLEGALEALSAWVDDGFDIAIVTGRPPSAAEVTIEWLRTHRVPHHSFYVVNKYDRDDSDGHHAISLDQLATMEFSFAVEDSLEMARYIAGIMGHRVALFDKPWNQSTRLDRRITRYGSWTDIQQAVLRIDE